MIFLPELMSVFADCLLPEDPFLTPKIDVVDCTSMDANVNGIRHSCLESELANAVTALEEAGDVCFRMQSKLGRILFAWLCLPCPPVS